MDIGVFIFPTDTTMQPVELARNAEERGFESLWFPEHSHIPTSRETPWGGRKDAPPLPEHYWRTHDQFVALAACAAVTTRLKLGTGITLVAQRDPIWLAKQVASLDMISGGRVLFGIGYGWNKEEMANHGLAYTERRAILREKILAMQQLWTEDEASFKGEHVDLEPSWSWPKPAQKPHPPIILGGGAGPKTFRHIAEFCDGWMPLSGRHELVTKLGMLAEACAEFDRDPATVELGFFGAPPDPAKLAWMAKAGVKRAVLALPQGAAGEVEQVMDSYVPLVAEFAG